MAVVALLHPGAMGSRIGGELVATGHQVRWLAAGRSDASRARARTEGLTAVDDPAALVDGADLVLSVLPPQAALDVARLVASTGFAGTYVDANPLSPGTLRECGSRSRGPARPWSTAASSGRRRARAERTHSTSPVRRTPWRRWRRRRRLPGDPVVLGEEVGRASAAKQAYALFNKGRMVLASLAAEIAEAHGVTDVLAAEAGRPGAELLGELPDLRAGLADVGWRWGPEMDEVVLTLAAAGSDPSAVEGLAAQLRRLAP